MLIESNFENCNPGALRLYLLNTRDYICEICKLTTWLDKPIPLQMDHIDGNHTNNNPNNLRLICPNCHSLTPNFGAKNRGYGRHKRRERYKQGKSY